MLYIAPCYTTLSMVVYNPFNGGILERVGLSSLDYNNYFSWWVYCWSMEVPTKGFCQLYALKNLSNKPTC